MTVRCDMTCSLHYAIEKRHIFNPLEVIIGIFKGNIIGAAVDIERRCVNVGEVVLCGRRYRKSGAGACIEHAAIDNAYRIYARIIGRFNGHKAATGLAHDCDTFGVDAGA